MAARELRRVLAPPAVLLRLRRDRRRGPIVALRSIIQSVRTGLMREARATIAADVLVQSNRALGRRR